MSENRPHMCQESRISPEVARYPLGIRWENRPFHGISHEMAGSADAVVVEDDGGWGGEDLGVVAGIGVVRDEVADAGEA